MRKSDENSIKTVLPPLYNRLVEKTAEYTGMSKSSIVADAVKDKFDKMPIQDKEFLLNSKKI